MHGQKGVQGHLHGVGAAPQRGAANKQSPVLGENVLRPGQNGALRFAVGLEILALGKAQQRNDHRDDRDAAQNKMPAVGTLRIHQGPAVGARHQTEDEDHGHQPVDGRHGHFQALLHERYGGHLTGAVQAENNAYDHQADPERGNYPELQAQKYPAQQQQNSQHGKRHHVSLLHGGNERSREEVDDGRADGHGSRHGLGDPGALGHAVDARQLFHDEILHGPQNEGGKQRGS